MCIQINSANELILTELILDNTFAAYEPEEVVALLSCFIFQEKTDNEPLLTPKLEEVRAALAGFCPLHNRITLTRLPVLSTWCAGQSDNRSRG